MQGGGHLHPHLASLVHSASGMWRARFAASTGRAPSQVPCNTLCPIIFDLNQNFLATGCAAAVLRKVLGRRLAIVRISEGRA